MADEKVAQARLRKTMDEFLTDVDEADADPTVVLQRALNVVAGSANALVQRASNGEEVTQERLEFTTKQAAEIARVAKLVDDSGVAQRVVALQEAQMELMSSALFEALLEGGAEADVVRRVLPLFAAKMAAGG